MNTIHLYFSVTFAHTTFLIYLHNLLLLSACALLMARIDKTKCSKFNIRPRNAHWKTIFQTNKMQQTATLTNVPGLGNRHKQMWRGKTRFVSAQPSPRGLSVTYFLSFFSDYYKIILYHRPQLNDSWRMFIFILTYHHFNSCFLE